MRIVLEGLTGTGKSQTLAAMERLGLAPGVVVREEETFGEVMDEIERSGADPAHLTRRLVGVCERVVESGTPSFLLERFHPSYFALLPRWELYDGLDARLAARNVSLVVLRVSDDSLRARSLLRREHGGTDWQGMAAHYGSEPKALEALRTSQDRRLQALQQSRLRSLVIDTGGEDWEGYARRITAWAN